jgi:hypothetical protein
MIGKSESKNCMKSLSYVAWQEKGQCKQHKRKLIGCVYLFIGPYGLAQ